MKKKLIVLTLVLTLVLPLAACGQTPSDTPPLDDTKPPLDTVENTDDPSELFIGDWVISGLTAMSEVSAVSEDEAEELIGTRISYAEKDGVISIAVNDAESVAAGINKQAVDAKFFEDNFVGVSLADLAPDAEAVQSVTLDLQASLLGSYFYIIDDETLIIYLEGAFFEAVRC